jgi:hypothetical protein
LNAPAQLNLEADGYCAQKWFDEDGRTQCVTVWKCLIADLNAVSHTTELLVQRH